MRRLSSLILLALAAAAGAHAEPGNEPLTGAQMTAELYGVRLTGVELATGNRWSECIEPGGRTVYEIYDYRSEGLLDITEVPAACFIYDTGPSCFRVQRAAKGYLFRSLDGGGTFHATKVERGIKSCSASELIG
jgi:hypothetical protein